MSDFSDILRALSHPRAYPHPVTASIEVVQTQMSAVFLTGEYAYKVKKPVDLGYLDYTTLEKRHHFCSREVELNRRLCPDTYLDAVPLSKGSSGKISIGGGGEVIEYAVKMRQLPRERMMDRLLLNGEVSPQMVQSVADKLARFHREAEASRYISSYGELCTIMVNTDENFTQTEAYIGRALSQEQYQKIKDYTEAFIRNNAALMHDRIDEGRIRDCHGDLHAAHVCFSDGICIYDCIEFNDRFRYSDVASEVAFLAMDLDRYQRPDLSRHFVDAYVKASADATLMAVLPFYKCYRAYVRGKVESFKLDDPYLSEEDKAGALNSARRYFQLAFSYATKVPSLVIMVGLVATGKTTVAQALAERLGAPVVSSDVVRKRLAGIPATEHRYEDFEGGIYSPEFSRRTYDAVLHEARELLTQGRSVVIDASFQSSEQRARAKDLARELSAGFMAVECVLPDTEAKRRLDRRMGEVTASDGRWEVYVKQKTTFQPVLEIPDSDHAVVDTSAPWEEKIAELAERLAT
ncbi:MAG: AAA family ATPase [Chloroflexota bacterium]